MSFLPMWKTLLKAFLNKPATLKTPKVFAVTRGRIENDIPACIFCGICQKKCPTRAIKVERAERTWAIARFDCMQCGCCAEACPKKCLRMTNEPPDAMGAQEWYVEKGAPLPPKEPPAPKQADA